MKLIESLKKVIEDIDLSFSDEKIIVHKYDVTPARKLFRIRIFLDKILENGDCGITIDDCSKVGRYFKKEVDKIDETLLYDLEVSSPGATRELNTLDDYRRFKNKKVKVVLKSDGKKIVKKGIISEINENEDILEILLEDDKRENIKFSEIKKANLTI